MLDPQRKRYYDEIQKVFEMEGWKYIVSDALAQAESIRWNAIDVPDPYQMGVRKGIVNQLEEFAALETITANLRYAEEEGDE